jgi:hypothetical protein
MNEEEKKKEIAGVLARAMVCGVGVKECAEVINSIMVNEEATCKKFIKAMKELSAVSKKATLEFSNLGIVLDRLPRTPLQKIIECIRDTIALLPILNKENETY